MRYNCCVIIEFVIHDLFVPYNTVSTVVRAGNHEDGQKPGRPDKPKLYKPTSKLAQLAATFQSVKDAKKEDERERERNVRHLGQTNYYVCILVPLLANHDYLQFQRQQNKKQGEKKKSNLELFKEELKEYVAYIDLLIKSWNRH